MKNRTNIDWSKHEVTEVTTENFSKITLAIPNTVMYSVNFINTCGVLLVTGDYSRWSFCRTFRPEPGTYVSDEYWLEKLQSGSIQDPLVFSAEKTRERLIEMLREDIWDEYSIGAPGVTALSRLETCSSHQVQDVLSDCPVDILEALEWLIGAKETINEGHLVYMDCMNDRPEHTCLDLPEVFETHPQLLAVFDAFDEICRRLKVKEQ